MIIIILVWLFIGFMSALINFANKDLEGISWDAFREWGIATLLGPIYIIIIIRKKNKKEE